MTGSPGYSAVVMRKAFDDLNDDKAFYEQIDADIGEYYRDSLLADIESLIIYAAVHAREHGLRKMLSRRFP